jgi:nucleoside 2-deoxyribosyltransferase
MRVYLAGPDVFLPDTAARAAALKAICARHGLEGVFPLDAHRHETASWSALSEARRIALRNEAHMAGCAVLIANLTPFRGPSADAGTIFEIGYMRALGRPVFGWTNCGDPFTERTRAHLGATGARDAEGMLIEAFGLIDNLMIDAAIIASGGALFVHPAPVSARWSDLTAFERCAAAVARHSGRGANGPSAAATPNGPGSAP